MKYTNFFRFLVWVIVVILLIVVVIVWRNRRVDQVANVQPSIPALTATPKPTPKPTPSFVAYNATPTPVTSTITTDNLPTSGPAEDGLILAGLAVLTASGSLLIGRYRRLQTAARSIEIR